MRALAKESHQRFPTVQAFANALEQASHTKRSNSIPPHPKPTPHPQPTPTVPPTVPTLPETSESGQIAIDTLTIQPQPPKKIIFGALA